MPRASHSKIAIFLFRLKSCLGNDLGTEITHLNSEIDEKWLTRPAKWVSLERNGAEWLELGELKLDMLLTGSYRRAMDDKLRFAMPKQLRDAIGEHDQDLYMTPGTDQSLAIYTAHGLQSLGENLANSSPAAKDTRAFSRLFYAQTQPAELDGQGRMRVPPELAELAGLTDDVIVLGVRDHIEVWNPVAWEDFLAQTQPRYDELAESVLRYQQGNQRRSSTIE